MQRRAFVIAVMDAVGVDQMLALRRSRRLDRWILVRHVEMNRIAAERFLAEFFDFDTLHFDVRIAFAKLQLAAPMQIWVAAMDRWAGRFGSQEAAARNQCDFGALVDAEIARPTCPKARRPGAARSAAVWTAVA